MGYGLYLVFVSFFFFFFLIWVCEYGFGSVGGGGGGGGCYAVGEGRDCNAMVVYLFIYLFFSFCYEIDLAFGPPYQFFFCWATDWALKWYGWTGPAGPDRASLRVKKNMFIKRGGFG